MDTGSQKILIFGLWFYLIVLKKLIGNHLKINKKLYGFLVKYMEKSPIPNSVSFLISKTTKIFFSSSSNI